MVGRRIKAVGLLCLAASAFACSKTEDTAPERRIFGSPPSIESVEVIDIPASSAVCDWSEAVRHILTCDFGLDPAYIPDPIGPVIVTTTYNEVIFQVQVTDPESTPSQTDILLVTASYITSKDGQPQEVSLVILDDGGTNQFDFLQKADFYNEDCGPLDPITCNNLVAGNPPCDEDLTGPDGVPDGKPDTVRTETCCCTYCAPKTYKLDTNDATMGDGLYTRGFAFKLLSGGGVPAGIRAAGLVDDCLVSQKRQAPAESTNLAGAPVAFKIEAIDRSGNIAVWPLTPEVTINPTSMTCTGDACACCYLTTSNFSNCRGLDGLRGQPGSGYENGACK